MLVPVGGLGYVYLNTALGDGVRVAADGYKHVDLQKMSSFAFDQRNGTIDDVPEAWRKLDGQKVILDGEIAPGKAAAGRVDKFELVWSVGDCCMTATPQIQHFVQCSTADGETTKVYRQPVRVRGTLRVDVRRDESKNIVGVYWLDVEDVTPLG